MKESKVPTVLVIVGDAQTAGMIRQKVQSDLGKLPVVTTDVDVAKMLLEMYSFELVMVGRDVPEDIETDIQISQELRCHPNSRNENIRVLFVYEYITERQERRIRQAVANGAEGFNWILMSAKIEMV